MCGSRMLHSGLRPVRRKCCSLFLSPPLPGRRPPSLLCSSDDVVGLCYNCEPMHRACERMLSWQASFQYNTQRSGDSYADFYGTAATSSAELCHDKCTPYVAAAFASYVPRSSPTTNDAECHCVGVTSTSSTLAGATVSTLCRRQWCASEALNAPFATWLLYLCITVLSLTPSSLSCNRADSLL